MLIELIKQKTSINLSLLKTDYNQAQTKTKNEGDTTFLNASVRLIIS